MLGRLKAASPRPAPTDCRIRLLLDPFLCVGPGSEGHAGNLFRISQQCAALGITLCIEQRAWQDAARDPDVLRRRVDLSRFEPLYKLDSLVLPTEREAGEMFAPARSEVDLADLKLLSALHSRVADCLIALDGRVHALAARAGLASRVLTPADALDWLTALAGRQRPVSLRELDPRSTVRPGPLSELIRDECEPYDPYLRDRLAAGRGRVLATLADGEPLAIGVIESDPRGERLALVALAARETARGAHVLEPILSAALGMARRRALPLAALLPPHEEMALQLLEDVGFRRLGPGHAGRSQWLHAVEDLVPRPADGGCAWLLALDAATHDRLLPELSGAAQAQLFAVDADGEPRTLGSTLRKQLILPPSRRLPARGDLLLFFHGRATRRPASASLTCVARVERAVECGRLEHVLALNASRPGCSLETIQSRLADGPVLVLDAAMLGRLGRFLPLAALRSLEAVRSEPRGLQPLPAHAWQRIAGHLALG